MAFDGITIAALSQELNQKLSGGHIRKIAQPEPDELILTIQSLRLKLSANASLPLVYLTSENKPSPLTAPNFCMLLRKHLSGAVVTSVRQEGFERVIRILISGKNELGDDVIYSVVIEIMGKHSNIVFLDSNDVIIDSIKHVNALMSSVREVLPGRPYFIPNTQEKASPFSITTSDWNNIIFKKPTTVVKAISGSMTGVSYPFAHEMAYRAHIDGDAPVSSLNGNEHSALMDVFRDMFEKVKNGDFYPEIYYDGDTPREFSCIPFTMYSDLKNSHEESPSSIIERFYREKDQQTRIHAKSAELRMAVQTCLERQVKKIGIIHKQLEDAGDCEKYRIYGELINTYGFTELPQLPVPAEKVGESPKKLHVTNFYDDTEVDIPIDPTKSVSDNANRYFEKYNKSKRTSEAASVQLKEAENAKNHLESILAELSIARHEEDLIAIREEIVDQGYMRKQNTKSQKKNKKQLPKSEPLHFVSSDGYDIYVGKNNYQNEELTFHMATGNDWWFHAKQMPGSHVILKSNNEEPPVSSFEEAASLAALFSKGNGSEKLEIDYTQKKNVKKPNGGKPGFVVYYTNYSMIASVENLKRVKPFSDEEASYL